MRNALLVALLFCLLAIAVPASAKGSFVYVSNYGDGTIAQYRVKANGALVPLSPPKVSAHSFAHAIAADARGQFLYVLSARDWAKRDCLVSQFRIGQDGRLSPLSPKTVPVPGTPSALLVEPSGKFVYVFTREGGVAQFRVQRGGGLVPLSPLALRAAHAGGIVPSVGFDAAHQVLFGSYSVGWHMNITAGTFAFSRRGKGQLVPVPGGMTLASNGVDNSTLPYSLTVSPTGHNVYISQTLCKLRPAGGGWKTTVAQYRTRAGGRLIPLSPATLPVKALGHTYVNPTGRFFYILDEGVDLNGVRGYYCLVCAPIHRNGTLGTFVSQTLAPAAPTPPMQPFSWAFSPNGCFAYFADGNYLYLYRCRADGSVSPLRPDHLYAGYGPLGVCAVGN